MSLATGNPGSNLSSGDSFPFYQSELYSIVDAHSKHNSKFIKKRFSIGKRYTAQGYSHVQSRQDVSVGGISKGKGRQCIFEKTRILPADCM